MADCTSNCRLRSHGTYITSVVTKEPLESIQSIISCRCSNPLRNKDKLGRNALHVSASSGRVDVLNWLCSQLKATSFLQMKDKESGWTPLHRALYYGHIDCAITILKKSHELQLCDNEGNTPMDLLILDSPRTKKKRKTKDRLAVVTLPFEAGDLGELTLNVGDIIQVLHQNQSGWAVGRIKHNGSKGLFPFNFVEEIKELNNIEKNERVLEQIDAYMFGNNVNFNLGLGDSKNRPHPEPLESLSGMGKTIAQIELTKFSSIFLTKCGEVYTCGHGLGGRLGHNNEETIMLPARIKFLSNIICKAVAAAGHHTMVLDEHGQVYTFGLNDFHQLGHTPPPKKYLCPTQITHKSVKGKEIIGIRCARFHSVVYTKYELYTFGLNAGQLGHIKASEQLITTPRLVTPLYRKDTCIRDVATSDGATICLMENNEIFLLYEYVCRKIAIKMFDVQQITISGGTLDYKGMENSQPEPLKVALLHHTGLVEAWRPHYKNFKHCHWHGNKLINKRIKHIALGRHMVCTTDDGQLYFAHFQRRSESVKSNTNAPSNKVEVVKGKFSLNEVIEKNKQKRSEFEEMQLERVPFLYRSVKCFCDTKSRSFAVIQSDARTGLSRYPYVRASTIENDFTRLLSEASTADSLHDAIVKGKSITVPVHQFMMDCRMQDEINRKVQDKDEIIYDFSDYSNDTLNIFLNKIYRCSKTQVETSIVQDRTVETGCSDQDFANQMRSLELVDLINPADQISPCVDELTKSVIQKRKKVESAYAVKKQNENNKVGIKSTKAKNLKKNVVTFNSLDAWRKHTSLSDVTIESEDKKLLKCHKCVLTSRLEYFNNMLNNQWLESSLQKDAVLKIPIPSNILSVVIHYLYTDDAPMLNETTDISFIGEVLVCADQMLIIRLKEICELALAEKVSVKNAVEIFQFSCTFNVEQLKTFICEFISMNLPFYLESRLLEDLSLDELTALSTVYREMVVDMEFRRIKPSDYHNEIDRLEKLSEEETFNELNRLKSKRKRTPSSNNHTSNNPTYKIDSGDREKHGSSSSIDENPQLVTSNTTLNQVSISRQPTNIQANTSMHPSNMIPPKNSNESKPINIGNSPFKKKSQKDRKLDKLRRTSSLEETTHTNVETTKSLKPAWGQLAAGKPTASFKDLMIEEKPTMNGHHSNEKMTKIKPYRKNWKKSDIFTTESDKHNSSNPWQKLPSPQKNRPDKSVSYFSDILNVQQEEREEMHAKAKKPITIIQLEEKAIEELKHYYESNSQHKEYITVRRVKLAADIPFWDRVMIE